MKKMQSIAVALLTAYVCSAAHKPEELAACPVSENLRGHENIEWTRAYAYGLTDSSRHLPRVLLVGDSIVCGYEGGVRCELRGKMNVSYLATSYCVTSPGYLKLLSFHLGEAKYDVIHFNNGLHSLSTPTAEWAKGFRAALELIRAMQPQARIVWATSTPLKDPRKTAKSRKLNAAGAKIVAEMGGIDTDDLFAAMNPLDRVKDWSDTFHFRPHAIAKQAKIVAASCLKALEKAEIWQELPDEDIGHH